MEADDKSFEKLLLFCFFFAVAFIVYLCVSNPVRAPFPLPPACVLTTFFYSLAVLSTCLREPMLWLWHEGLSALRDESRPFSARSVYDRPMHFGGGSSTSAGTSTEEYEMVSSFDPDYANSAALRDEEWRAHPNGLRRYARRG